MLAVAGAFTRPFLCCTLLSHHLLPLLPKPSARGSLCRFSYAQRIGRLGGSAGGPTAALQHQLCPRQSAARRVGRRLWRLFLCPVGDRRQQGGRQSLCRFCRAFPGRLCGAAAANYCRRRLWRLCLVVDVTGDRRKGRGRAGTQRPVRRVSRAVWHGQHTGGTVGGGWRQSPVACSSGARGSTRGRVL